VEVHRLDGSFVRRWSCPFHTLAGEKHRAVDLVAHPLQDLVFVSTTSRDRETHIQSFRQDGTFVKKYPFPINLGWVGPYFRLMLLSERGLLLAVDYVGSRFFVAEIEGASGFRECGGLSLWKPTVIDPQNHDLIHCQTVDGIVTYQL
jgi:hypothetical protein